MGTSGKTKIARFRLPRLRFNLFDNAGKEHERNRERIYGRSILDTSARAKADSLDLPTATGFREGLSREAIVGEYRDVLRGREIISDGNVSSPSPRPSPQRGEGEGSIFNRIIDGILRLLAPFKNIADAHASGNVLGMAIFGAGGGGDTSKKSANAMEVWRSYPEEIRALFARAKGVTTEIMEQNIRDDGWVSFSDSILTAINTPAAAAQAYLTLDRPSDLRQDAMKAADTIGQILEPIERDKERESAFYEEIDGRRLATVYRTLVTMSQLGRPEHLKAWESFWKERTISDRQFIQTLQGAPKEIHEAFARYAIAIVDPKKPHIPEGFENKSFKDLTADNLVNLLIHVLSNTTGLLMATAEFEGGLKAEMKSGYFEGINAPFVIILIKFFDTLKIPESRLKLYKLLAEPSPNRVSVPHDKHMITALHLLDEVLVLTDKKPRFVQEWAPVIRYHEAIQAKAKAEAEKDL